MKRLTILSTLLLTLLTSLSAGDIYVSPNGNDRGDGTQTTPLKTIHQALRQAREWRRLGDNRVTNGINIILLAGSYKMDEPLFIRPEDSGTEDAPTIIRSKEGEKAVLCGDPMQHHQQLYPATGM